MSRKEIRLTQPDANPFSPEQVVSRVLDLPGNGSMNQILARVNALQITDRERKPILSSLGLDRDQRSLRRTISSLSKAGFVGGDILLLAQLGREILIDKGGPLTALVNPIDKPLHDMAPVLYDYLKFYEYTIGSFLKTPSTLSTPLLLGLLGLLPLATVIGPRGAKKFAESWDWGQFTTKAETKKKELIKIGELPVNLAGHTVTFGTSGTLATPLLETLKSFNTPVLPVSRGEVNEYPDANKLRYWVSAGKSRDLETTRRLAKYEILMRANAALASVVLVNMTRGPLAPYRPFNGQDNEKLRMMEGVIPPDTGEQIFENITRLQRLIFGEKIPPQLRIAILSRETTFGYDVNLKNKRPAWKLFRESGDLPTFIVMPEDLIEREIKRMLKEDLKIERKKPRIYIRGIGDDSTDRQTSKNIIKGFKEAGIGSPFDSNDRELLLQNADVIVITGADDQQVASEVQQFKEFLKDIGKEIPIIAILKKPDEGNMVEDIRGKNVYIIPVQNLVSAEVKKIMKENLRAEKVTNIPQTLTEISQERALQKYFRKIQQRVIASALAS